MLPLILASSSPARKALLEKLQIPFQTVSPDIDETPLSHEKPKDLALRLAIEKASAVKKKYPEALIIGADQVIMCGKTRLDKPGTVENAIAQLTLVSGKSIEAYTGLCLLNTKTGKCHSTVSTYQVYFRQLSPKIIESYIQRDNPLHCAGSIKAESLGITLFTKMQGDDFTSLPGLPLIALTDFLLTEGFTL